MTKRSVQDELFAILAAIGSDEETSKISRIKAIEIVRAIAQDIEQRRAKVAVRFNLTSSELGALFLLQRANALSLRAVDLQQTIGLTSGGMSKSLDRLEKTKLIRRVGDKGDGRVRRLRITDAGKRMATAARHDPTWEPIEQLLVRLEESEWTLLYQLLAKLWHGLAE